MLTTLPLRHFDVRRWITWMVVGVCTWFFWGCNGLVCGQTVLLEESFDKPLAEPWQWDSVAAGGVRTRDGGLEVRMAPSPSGQECMLLFPLPFSTAETVTVEVDVQIVGEPIRNGEFAGICLTKDRKSIFTVRKASIDGYFVFSPGQPEFIGKAGQEGDPGQYSVRYWPARASDGKLRIVVRGDYAYFQVGPNTSGEYKTYFHTAIERSDDQMGIGLVISAGPGGGERWARFDNLKVVKN